MRYDGVAGTVAVELANAGTDEQSHRQGSDPAYRVDDTGPGKITVAFAQPEIRPQLRQPSSAPGPIAIQRISESTHQHRRHRKGQELPTFGARPRNNGEGCVH